MKKIFVLIAVLFTQVSAFAAIDTWFNTNPRKEYDKVITLQKTSSDTYDKDGIKIEKNVFKFDYSYKEGIPYEYIVTNNTEDDLLLKGIDSDYHANKNIKRKSHWTRVNVRNLKYWQTYVPFVDDYYGYLSTVEQTPFLHDFPKNYILKKGENLRLLAMGLHLDRIQDLTFIFDNNEGNDLKITF